MNKKVFLKAKEDKIGLLMQSESTRINIYIEGKDDYNFYYQFFKNYNPNMIRSYSKKNVLEVAELYNKIGDNKSIFFIDKDFDNNKTIDNVFVTNYYNFESHIFSRNNISHYLSNKHSLHAKDIKNLIVFLNSQDILNVFHTEYERIMLYAGESENKLIPGKLNIVTITETYNFNYNKLFTKGRIPTLSTKLLSCIEMYNGKYIGNLILSIFLSPWFNKKFKEDSRKFDRKQLTSEMILHSCIPNYISNAISHLATE